MLVLYKPNIDFLTEHAEGPDKRRYAVAAGGPRHFIDIDHFGRYPYAELPHKWNDAIEKFGEDSLLAYGIVSWHIQVMQKRLIRAFKEKYFAPIMKNSADFGHYIADAHVPLHASTNLTGNLPANWEFMDYGQAVFPNCWQTSNLIPLPERRLIFKIPKRLSAIL